jgi:hypothetical protein
MMPKTVTIIPKVENIAMADTMIFLVAIIRTMKAKHKAMADPLKQLVKKALSESIQDQKSCAVWNPLFIPSGA